MHCLFRFSGIFTMATMNPEKPFPLKTAAQRTREDLDNDVPATPFFKSLPPELQELVYPSFRRAPTDNAAGKQVLDYEFPDGLQDNWLVPMFPERTRTLQELHTLSVMAWVHYRKPLISQETRMVSTMAAKWLAKSIMDKNYM
mmetsp:Transcript_32483/g.41564  ORF Transcript_32483/g.41564 Transcript_32483/m.41564 type:complete len:143 (+) Transcript_32483:123-551(+)